MGPWSLLNRPPNYACICWALCVFVCVYPCVSREAIKVIGAILREDESFYDINNPICMTIEIN